MSSCTPSWQVLSTVGVDRCGLKGAGRASDRSVGLAHLGILYPK